ncbi:MAG: hypothetical protein ACAH59_11765 [Pseudobdellovibrionaceae bacterium]
MLLRQGTIAILLIAQVLSVGPKAKAARTVEEIVAQQALVGAIKEPATDFLKAKINDAISMKLGSTPTQPNGAGNTMFAVVDFGFAVDEYGRAENDKQRFYAGARGANAILSVVAPPAGVVVGVVLLVAGLTETILGAASAEEMMRLETLILKYRMATFDIYKSFSSADRAGLHAADVMKLEAYNRLKVITLEMNEKCSSEEKILLNDILQTCIGLVVQTANALKAIIHLTEYQLEAPLLVLDRELFFKNSQIKISELEKKLNESRKRAEIADREIKEFIAYATKTLIAETVKEANRNGLPDEREAFFDWCYNDSLNLIREGAIALHYGKNVPQDLKVLLGRVDRFGLAQKIEHFEAQDCMGNADQTHRRYSQLVKNLNVLRKYKEKHL